jgi:hypothetical protein
MPVYLVRKGYLWILHAAYTVDGPWLAKNILTLCVDWLRLGFLGYLSSSVAGIHLIPLPAFRMVLLLSFLHIEDGLLRLVNVLKGVSNKVAFLALVVL